MLPGLPPQAFLSRQLQQIHQTSECANKGNPGGYSLQGPASNSPNLKSAHVVPQRERAVPVGLARRNFPEVKGHTFVANRWGGHRRTPRQSKNMNQFFHGSLPSGTTPTTVDVGPNGFTVAIYLSDARSIDAVLTNRDAGLAAHMLAIYHPERCVA